MGYTSADVGESSPPKVRTTSALGPHWPENCNTDCETLQKVPSYRAQETHVSGERRSPEIKESFRAARLQWQPKLEIFPVNILQPLLAGIATNGNRHCTSI